VSVQLSFVVPVRNDAARLDRCLRSILADRPSVPFEIIVADNGSTDDSADVARRAGATVVSLPNRAVSDVRNQAAASAQGELLAFVDADHELGPGWTNTALQLFATSSAWAAGADYHAPADGTWVQRMYDRLRPHAEGPQNALWLPSGNLVVRRCAFEQVGGFDTTLESCEDVDFCRRIREAGGTLTECGALHSVHHGDPRTLRALFVAELWRGRDNLRVSLRERLTLRSAPSIIVPVLHLLTMVGALAGLIGAVVGRGIGWTIVSVLVAASLSGARALRLLSRVPPRERRAGQVLRAWVLVAVYDAARALALVFRASHDVRRRG
jgi:GT2 family glycosyltransferase